MSFLRFSVVLVVARLSVVDALFSNANSTSFHNGTSTAVSISSHDGTSTADSTSLHNGTSTASLTSSHNGTSTASLTSSHNGTRSAIPTSSLNATSTAISNVTTTVQNIGAACNAEYISWSLASEDYSRTGTVYVTETITNTVNYNKTLLASTTFDCATKCDTICYATNVSSTISLSSISSEDTITYSDKEEYTRPTPTCSIGFSDCLNLLTSYSSEVSQWYTDDHSSITLTAAPIRPSCSACVSTGCTFQDAGMSLYYWPVTTSISRDMCAWEPVGGIASTYVPDMNRTFAPTTTGPYAVVDGRTLYQGNVYLSIVEPYVYDNCGNSVSRKYPNGDNVVTIASSDLYSVRKYPHNLIPWSVNYQDFIEPVPWSAYYGGRYCANNRPLCSVVMPGQYKPEMIMPPQMRNLDPAWESCAFDQYALFDPPVALQPASGFLSSTTQASDPTQTPAEPGHSPPSAGPSATQAPGAGDPIPTNGNGGESSGPKPTGGNENNDPSPTNGNGAPVPGNTKTTKGTGDENNDPSPTNGNGTPVPGNPIPGDPIPGDPIPGDPIPGDPIPGTPIPADPIPGNPIPGNTETTKGKGDENNDPSPTEIPNDPSNPGTPAQPPVITIGPSIIPIDPTGGVVVVPGITLSVGGPGTVISSTSLSMGSSGLVVISPATSTNIDFPAVPTAITIPGLADPITLQPKGEGSGDVVIAPGTTLSLGGPGIVVGGKTFSVAATGLVIIAPATSTEIPLRSQGQFLSLTLPGFGLDGPQILTVDAQGRLVMKGGKTLHAGDAPITVDGTTISVGASEIVVVHGTVTEKYSIPAAVTNSVSAVSSGVKAQDVTDIIDLATGKGSRSSVGGPEETGAVVGGTEKKGDAAKLGGSRVGWFAVAMSAFWMIFVGLI